MILDILINTAITIGGAAGAVAIITGLEKLKKVNDKANGSRDTTDDVVVYKKHGGGWFVAALYNGKESFHAVVNTYRAVSGMPNPPKGYVHTGYAAMAPSSAEYAGRLAWETSVIEDEDKGDYDDQGRPRIIFVSTP